MIFFGQKLLKLAIVLHRVQQACCFFLLLPSSVHFSHSLFPTLPISLLLLPLYSLFFCQKKRSWTTFYLVKQNKKAQFEKKLKIYGFCQCPVFIIMPYICPKLQGELHKCESTLNSSLEPQEPTTVSLCCQSIFSEIAIRNKTSKF